MSRPGPLPDPSRSPRPGPAGGGVPGPGPAGAPGVPGGSVPGGAGADPREPARPQTFYEAVGGEETFRTVVHEFYRRVREDDILGPMYPHDDWEGAEDRLRWFLAQYWGGPQEFTARRGHPRLRMRHARFTVDPAARDRWLELMGAAMDSVDRYTLPDAYREAMWDHMVRVANMLVNTPGEGML